MRYILTRLRRSRRKNRIPHGLLVSAVLLTLLLTFSVLVLPASARMRTPKASDGQVTDGDGIIDSDGVAGEVPPVTDLIPGMSTDAESGVKDPMTTERVTDPVTETTARVTEGVTTRPVTTAAADGAGNTAGGIAPWVIAFLIFAVIVTAIVVVIWWTMGRDRRR